MIPHNQVRVRSNARRTETQLSARGERSRVRADREVQRKPSGLVNGDTLVKFAFSDPTLGIAVGSEIFWSHGALAVVC